MTTRKRLLLSAASLAGLVAVVLVVLALIPSRPGVTRANFQRIQIGMTEAEVEAIFGGPGREFFRKWWFAPDGSWAAISFTSGRVVDTQWAEPQETTLDKIRRWLGFGADEVVAVEIR